jgi:hypothetical protein
MSLFAFVLRLLFSGTEIITVITMHACMRWMDRVYERSTSFRARTIKVCARLSKAWCNVQPTFLHECGRSCHIYS